MDVDKIIKSMKVQTKKICKSKKSAQEFLIRAGIYTKSGRLSKHYR